MTLEQHNIHGPSFKLAERKLKGKKGEKFAALRQQVIEPGLCTECGSCVASCAENAIQFVNNRPTLVGRCTSCGVCYNQCPRTITTSIGLVGNYMRAWTGKNNLNIEGQDGGIVTTLLTYLLREKIVDGVIVTIKDKKTWIPQPKLITNPEELLESAGSVYSHCKTIPKLIEAIESGMNSLAFVGTPCNIDAVHKMQTSPVGLVRLFMRTNILKVGLFCMDSFDPETLTNFFSIQHGIPTDSISKMTISKGKFYVYYGDNQTKVWRIHSLDHLRSTSCHYCTDLTSENADISVGSVGSKDGYSTILARTGIGVEIIQDAIDNGYIEVESLKRSALNRILALARMKKVSLYTLRRRRSYSVLPPPATDEVSEHRAISLEGKPGATTLFRRLVKVQDVSIYPNNPNMRITVANRSGRVLEKVKIRISHLCDLFEECAWEIPVSSWFPGEVLEFDYPRVKENENEYLLLVEDQGGKIMSKRILVEKVMKSTT